MILLPAIDLYRGQAVRLYKGDYDQMTVYDPVPVHTALKFREAGAKYIHVVDLAKGHVKAIEGMQKLEGVNVFNLGTGIGYSVLDIIRAFSEACGKELPYVIDPRRPGDIATCYSDPSKAKEILGWVAEKNLQDMCSDAWRWQSNNPDGYVED